MEETQKQREEREVDQAASELIDVLAMVLAEKHCKQANERKEKSSPS